VAKYLELKIAPKTIYFQKKGGDQIFRVIKYLEKIWYTAIT